MNQWNRAFFRNVWQLSKGFWSSSVRWRMIACAVAIAAAQAIYVSIMVNYNAWQKDFYNTIEAADPASFFYYLKFWPMYMVIFIFIEVNRDYVMQYLEIKWRTWLVNDFVKHWLSGRAYYLMQLVGQGAGEKLDNPDQRIADDVRLFVSYVLNLSLGLLNAVMKLSSFGAVLWGLSGIVTVPIGNGFALAGYMVWIAIVYALLGSGLTLWAGRPIVRLNNKQQEYEADFRFGLARLRDHFESIAFYHGEAQEEVGAMRRFEYVRRNFRRLMLRQMGLSWVTSLHWRVGFLFPFLVGVPRVFSGDMQFGGLFQTSVAFQQVVNSLSFLVLRYYSTTEASIAQLQTVVHRLTDFRRRIEEAERTMQEAPAHLQRGDALAVHDLAVERPEGGALVEHLSLDIAPGRHLFISGPSGRGKSTLLKAMAGIWPYAAGEIVLPEQGSILFLPQKPYLPLGNLRDALLYPSSGETVADGAIREALRCVRLEALADDLDQEENWAHALSPGEQQRLAFAKILLLKPAWVFLDEATSSLDEENESLMYKLVLERSPQTTLLSIGHRMSLRFFHKQHLKLGEGASWQLSEVEERD